MKGKSKCWYHWNNLRNSTFPINFNDVTFTLEKYIRNFQVLNLFIHPELTENSTKLCQGDQYRILVQIEKNGDYHDS